MQPSRMQPTPLQPTGRHMRDRGLLAALLAALLACWRFFGFWRDDNAYSVGTCHPAPTYTCTTKERQDSYDTAVLNGWMRASGVVGCCPSRTTMLLVARYLAAPLLAPPPKSSPQLPSDQSFFTCHTRLLHKDFSFVA